MEARTEIRERGGDDEIEVRRLHIVYFLSRKGRVEQPHLIRVEHLSSNAVHLRDVKRWLSELRGTEMADSFAWSYKRKYKTGYIWQDLADDDLIAPVSDDDEYVLKGSLFPSLGKAVEDSLGISAKNKVQEGAEDGERKEEATKPPPAGTATSASTSSSEDREQRTAVFRLDSWRAEQQRCKEIVMKKKGRKGDGDRAENGGRGWASDVLKNLLKCRTAEIKDSVTRTASIQRSGGGSSNVGRNKEEMRDSKGRAAPAMHKPATEPYCSQCGRPFRPEKLSSHMNSCRSLKVRVRR